MPIRARGLRRLHYLAAMLRPTPKEFPEYVRDPVLDVSSGPGWYMTDTRGRRLYLGFSTPIAESKLRALVERQEAKRGGR